MSSAFIGWRTGAHFEFAYHQIAHCTYSLNLYLLAYCLSIRLAPITHFLLNLLTRNSCHLHCILSSAHIATHIGSCTLHFLAQREFEAQGKIPIVPLSDLQVGNIYRADDCICLEKCMKWGGGFHIQVFRVSKLMNFKSKGCF